MQAFKQLKQITKAFRLKWLILIILATSIMSESSLNITFSNLVVPCAQFKNRQCIRCPDNSHLKQEQCYQDIKACIEYKYSLNFDECTKCNQTISLLNKGFCQPKMINITTITTTSSANGNSTTRTSSTTSNYSLFGSNQNSFKQIEVMEVQNDSYFKKCHNFMITGEYSHFISRSANPISSLFTYTSNGTKQFKIIYQGSGGNILQCLIGINLQTYAIILRSFVSIGRTQIVNFCIDYSSSLQCNACANGYHIDTINGQIICYQNIPFCIQYYANFCLKCRSNQILVENRCISDCKTLTDSRSIRFYGYIDIKNTTQMSQISSIQRNYYSL